MKLEEREKATAELTQKVEKKAKDRYGELVLTLQKGIGSSRHLLKGGKEDIFFFDFDSVVEDPLSCKEVAERFCEKVQQIAEYRERKPDFLGFIEKDGIGTVGAIRLSGFISSLTETPNILVRHTRELPYARIKVAKENQVDRHQRLKGKNVLIISDVTTTGKEIMDAIQLVRDNGGTVTDALVYFSRQSFESQKKFQETGVTLYALITEPQARDFAFSPENQEKASVIREVFRDVDKYLSEKQLV